MSAVHSYIIRCPSCGTKNRIPVDKTALTPKCGKCGGVIPADDLFTGKPVHVTDRDFNERVLKSPLPVLLDCWAPWCGPCQMIGPIIDALASEWKGRVKVCKITLDDNPETMTRYDIRSVPTLLIVDQGQVKDTLIGAVPKAQIVQKMTPYL